MPQSDNSHSGRRLLRSTSNAAQVEMITKS
jgi:hypothetical protein